MNFAASFWHKFCEPLDGFLWHRDISHPIIRPVLRNQILASGAAIICGAVFYAAIPWLFWFGAGVLCMTWIFWSWAKFFLRVDIGAYSAVFLRAILWRFAGRMAIMALLLYAALAWCHASGLAILGGLISGACLALTSYAIQTIFPGKP